MDTMCNIIEDPTLEKLYDDLFETKKANEITKYGRYRMEQPIVDILYAIIIKKTTTCLKENEATPGQTILHEKLSCWHDLKSILDGVVLVRFAGEEHPDRVFDHDFILTTMSYFISVRVIEVGVVRMSGDYFKFDKKKCPMEFITLSSDRYYEPSAMAVASIFEKASAKKNEEDEETRVTNKIRSSGKMYFMWCPARFNYLTPLHIALLSKRETAYYHFFEQMKWIPTVEESKKRKRSLETNLQIK